MTDITPDTPAGSYLVDAREAATDIFRCSERTYYEIRKRPDFPAPVILGSRTIRYRRSDLVAYIETLIADTPPPEPAQLRAGKAKRAAKREQEATRAES